MAPKKKGTRGGSSENVDPQSGQLPGLAPMPIVAALQGSPIPYTPPPKKEGRNASPAPVSPLKHPVQLLTSGNLVAVPQDLQRPSPKSTKEPAPVGPKRPVGRPPSSSKCCRCGCLRRALAPSCRFNCCLLLLTLWFLAAPGLFLAVGRLASSAAAFAEGAAPPPPSWPEPERI